MIKANIPTPGGTGEDFSARTWQQFFIRLAECFKIGDFRVQYAVNQLPPNQLEGCEAFATNGRKVGEGVGSGTGVPVYYSNGQWRVYSTDLQVTA